MVQRLRVKGGKMEFYAVPGRAIVKLETEQKMSEGGILIPDNAGKLTYLRRGEVLAMGEDVGDMPAPAEVGDRVIMSTYAQFEPLEEKSGIVAVRHNEIVAVVDGQ